MSDERTYRALVDVVSGGKGVEAGATFTASDESISQALAFGLVELVDDKSKAKSTSKRSSGKT